MKRGNGLPCPNCGGTDRLIPRQRLGGYRCTHCGHLEADGAALAAQSGAREQRQLTDEQRHAVYRAYALVAQHAQQQLYSQAGAAALDYLHRRGLTDETIKAAGLGYLPDGDNPDLASWLHATDQEAYHAAGLGGIMARQGRLLNLARDSIVFPYVAPVEGGQAAETRMLRFRSMQGKGYRSPSGVALFAGGPGCLFNGQNTADEHAVLLAEGEIKALAAQQAGIPAVAQPGIGQLTDDMIAQLAGKRVTICYDSEARKDPFVLSPGEQYTTRNGKKLAGADIRAKIAQLQQALQEGPDPGAAASIARQEAQLSGLPAHVLVARLPRQADQAKVDIDEYAIAHGAAALQDVMHKAQPFLLWHERRKGGGYYFQKGATWQPDKKEDAPPRMIANYQAIIVEDITLSDGQQEHRVHRLAIRTPGGALRYEDVPADNWTDDRAARKALRGAAADGIAHDEIGILQAVKALSMQGDGPAARRVYTATGWEAINGRWHYLTRDGATHSQGTTTIYRAEIDAAAIGNHYALCDSEGSAAAGWAAWKRFLLGDVCPQPIALLLAGHAALALVHRFTGNSDRPMPWLQAQSGVLKTSMVRAGVLALWGRKFTAQRGAGAAVSKWDATGAGLEYTAFYFRDAPLLIDDYKQGVIHDGQFKRFLHNYSEGTGRTRGTKARTLDTVKPARALVISTGEDTPGNGDGGITARITKLPLAQGSIDPAQLAALQEAGEAGHLAAFWRGFVQTLAGNLDKHGADGMQRFLQQQLAKDDAAMPGHMRATGALRQNRAAFLLLAAWLQQAGYLTPDERAALEAAHVQARVNLAAQLEAEQQRNLPSTIFIELVDALQQQGYRIEQPDMTCPECGGQLHREPTGWYCGNESVAAGDMSKSRGVCRYRLPLDRVIGFYTSGGQQIGLNINHCWALMQDMRRRQQQPLQFGRHAVIQQLHDAGYLARTEQNGYTVKVRNPANRGELQRCLLLHTAALDMGGGPPEDTPAPGPDDRPGGQADSPQQQPPRPAAAGRAVAALDTGQPDDRAACTGCTGHVPDFQEQPGTCDCAAESAKQGHVPDVPDVPGTHTHHVVISGTQSPAEKAAYMRETSGTPGTSGTWADIAHQEANEHVPGFQEQSGTTATCTGNGQEAGAALAVFVAGNDHDGWLLCLEVDGELCPIAGHEDYPDREAARRAAAAIKAQHAAPAPQPGQGSPEGGSGMSAGVAQQPGQPGRADLRSIPAPRRIVTLPGQQQTPARSEGARLGDDDLRLPAGWALTFVASAALWQAKNADTGQHTGQHRRDRAGRAALLQEIGQLAREHAAREARKGEAA